MAFLCGCDPRAGIICGAHCQMQGCRETRHTDVCIKGERIKTAADLPSGAEVFRWGTTWRKNQTGWVDADDNWHSDADIDRLLTLGGLITFVPIGNPRAAGKEASRG
jgi:hypothetical protein